MKNGLNPKNIRQNAKRKRITTVILVLLLMFPLFVFNLPVKLVDNSTAVSPTVIDITPSSDVCYIGHYIYLYINATDPEDSEDLLNVTAQWQYNESGPSGWHTSYFFAEPYQGTPDSGWLCVRFEPSIDAPYGRYDFRAKVIDTEGNSSINPIWVYVNGSVEIVTKPIPEEDIKLGYSKIFRGETLEIFLNASDLSDLECELTPEIQYKSPNGDWTDIPSSDMYYDDTNDNPNDLEGYWVISFTPGDNHETGIYQFRGRVKNSLGEYSNNGDWTYSIPTSAEVKNNLPEATDIRAEAKSVERGDSIYIYADGSDVETDEDAFTPHFQYMGPGGTWEDEYLSTISYTSGSWRVTFSPPADSDFPLGDYDFKVWFEDEDGDKSNELNLSEVSNKVEVKNAPPIVYSIDISASSGYRLEPITIVANVWDDDHDEAALEAIFEFRAPFGDWVSSQERGNYFDFPDFIRGQWQITFTPDDSAELGDYDFRVRFYDGLIYSDWITGDNLYTVMNNLPEVDINSPFPGEQETSDVFFSASAWDVEDTRLDYFWDFGDGRISVEESPRHTYSETGMYLVTIRVEDTDGATSEDSVLITITEVDEPRDNYVSLRFVLFIVFTLVVIITIVMATSIHSTQKRKKEGKGK